MTTRKAVEIDRHPPAVVRQAIEEPPRSASLKLGAQRLALTFADSVPLANSALVLVQVIGLVATARILGVEARGQYQAWTAWAALVGTLSLLGCPQAVVVIGRRRPDIGLRNVARVLLAGLLISILGSCLALALLGADPLALVGGAMLAGSGLLVAMSAAIHQARGCHGWRFNLTRVMPPVLGFAAVVPVLLAWAASPSMALFALGVGNLVGVLVALQVGGAFGRSDFAIDGAILRAGLKNTPLLLVSWLVVSGDVAVLAHVANSTELAYYGIGVGVRAVVAAVGTAVGMRWFARQSSLGSWRATARRFLPALAVAVLLIVALPMAVPRVLGDSFNPSVIPAQMMAMAGVVVSVDFLLVRKILVMGRIQAISSFKFLQFGLIVLGFVLCAENAAVYSGVYFVGVAAGIPVQYWLLRTKGAGT